MSGSSFTSCAAASPCPRADRRRLIAGATAGVALDPGDGPGDGKTPHQIYLQDAAVGASLCRLGAGPAERLIGDATARQMRLDAWSRTRLTDSCPDNAILRPAARFPCGRWSPW